MTESLMTYCRTFLSAVLAGVAIAIGGCVNLAVDSKPLGAALFTIGLFTVCTMGLNLFTGKVCYSLDNKPSYIISLIVIWFGNLAGTVFTGSIIRLTRLSSTVSSKAFSLCRTKLSDDLLSIFILAFFCNIMIYLGVEGYRMASEGTMKFAALLLAIMVFILCGFEHCVANMFYFTVGNGWSLKALLYLLVMTAGNAAGGLFFPAIRKVISIEKNNQVNNDPENNNKQNNQ